MVGSNFLNKLPHPLYCERGSALSFFAEPINAFSNLAFPVAGFLVYNFLKQRKITDKKILALPYFLSLIGLGSFIYHTQPSQFTILFDAIPIYFFVLFSLFLFLSHVFKSNRKAVIILAAFLGIEVFVSVIVPTQFFYGSVRHIVALTFLVLIGILIDRRYEKKLRTDMIVTLALYAGAIFLRNADMVICPWFNIGTHFFWHVLTAVAGLCAIKLIANLKQIV